MGIFADLAYAARTLRKSPLFLIMAVVTIALGIGAAAAIFSVTHAVLLQPLPYKSPERLVLACADMRQRNVRDIPMSTPDFMDLRNGTHGAFEDFTAVWTDRGLLEREDGTNEQVHLGIVPPNFFRLLGGRIVAGRDFTDVDGQPAARTDAGQPGGAPAAPQMVILSYEFWQRRFGGSRDIMGHPLQSFHGGVVIGVLQPGFELLLPPQFNAVTKPDFWMAARLRYDPRERNSFWLQSIGRLREGVTLERAQAEVSHVADAARRDFVIERTAGYHLRVEPMQKYVVERSRPAILALMGAVIFLLLIACANVANLMLVRASLRERELAVRTALGGNRWRLVRQILAEALLVAMAGTALGVGLAWLGLRELTAIGPANLPRLDSIRIDPAVTIFSALAGLAAAALFGVVPALRASRPDIAQVLRSSGRTSALGGGRLLRDAVVVAEVALCFVLLIGSGLMFRSFQALTRIDPGFDPHHLLTFSMVGGGQGRPQPEQRAALVRQIRERLGALPGVTAVSSTNPLALGGDFYPIRWGLEPALADPSKFQAVDSLIVLPGYFQTVRTPILEGRAFTDADDAPDQNVVVVDEFLARKAFGAESPIGKRILIRIRTPEPEWVRIIGVARHIRGSSLAEPGREQVYFTDGFLGHGAAFRWVLRTAGDPLSVAAPARAAIATIDRKLLLSELQPMDQLVEKAQSQTRFSLLLIGVFATLAALLAGVGLYGVLATVVRQRTAEIGVRVALGAAPARIFRLVVGQGMRLSLAGVAVGCVFAVFLTRLIKSMLVGTRPGDPLTYLAMAALFLAIAAVASWIPARRAACLDPNSALREE
ncbi:MAG: ABC transporter permease [Bryobacteraceae bacterium]|jgi:putative ABC transport system permease protein